MSDTVYIAGVGMTAFGRHPAWSVKDLTRRAVWAALDDAGCERSQLQAAYFANATQGRMDGQHMIRGQLALRAMGVQGLPVVNVENACASGSTALHLAVQHVRSGAADIVLAVAAEKMHAGDTASMAGAFEGAWDVHATETSRARLRHMSEGIVPPAQSMGIPPWSMMLDIEAAWGRLHMREFGSTQRDFAVVSSKNHGHAVHNPLAQCRAACTVEQVLAAPPLSYPLTLPMCSPPADGAAAAIACSEAGLKALRMARSREVRVLGCALQTGSDRGAADFEHHLVRLASRRLYEQAGLGPSEVDVAEVHDATAIGEVLQAELLGLVPMGSGGLAAERGETTIGGRIPINPSGGLLCKGHPIGASGLGQIVELVAQLRAGSGARQVHGARIALASNGGGFVGVENAVACLTLLGR